MIQDMEKGVKDFASQLETLVDRVISGQLAVEVTQNADKLVSGFIRHFEDGCVPTSLAACCTEKPQSPIPEHASKCAKEHPTSENCVESAQTRSQLALDHNYSPYMKQMKRVQGNDAVSPLETASQRLYIKVPQS